MTDLKDYDPGLLNDFGGGNVDWWQDYLRAEINRCNAFWREQAEVDRPASVPVEALRKLRRQFLSIGVLESAPFAATLLTRLIKDAEKQENTR